MKRVVHHSKTLGLSGTDRTAQIFCKYLMKGDKYDPYLIYREGDLANCRLDVMRDILGEDKVVPYQWEPGFTGRQPPYIPESTNLSEVLRTINPDIVHIHRSGYQEWPGFRELAPNAKWVETNIFGYNDNSGAIDKHIYISDYIRRKSRNLHADVLYNPIEKPYCLINPFRLDYVNEKIAARNNLIRKYKLPYECLILGRVGRADNFDPISLKAFKEFESRFPKAWYIVVNPCENWRSTAQKLNIKNIVFADPIIDSIELSEFYGGLDIYAHARHDGECCPCNIQEAMMHGVPVVSHVSKIDNGHVEIIGNAGVVVPIDDYKAYAVELTNLAVDQNYYDGRTRLVKERADLLFSARDITRRLEKIYDSLWIQ